MAEGILKSLASKENINIEVKSAGISVYEGEDAGENTIEAMREIGINMLGHKSTQIYKNLVDEVDLILTMSSSHKKFILLNYPYSKDKLFTLTEYAYGIDKDIMDPFGRSLVVYEKTRDEIYQVIIEIKTKIFKSEE